MDRAALCVEGLSFAYGGKTALSDVSFEVAKGRFCALLGLNGAGKSTLFALLTRLIVSRSGSIAVAGHDLSREPRRALARLGVVFQQPTLDLDLTVSANMTYFAALHGLWGGEADRRIAAALDRLGMLERKGEKVRALNGGHRRRMEIARALVHRPEVLLLDEPTVGLDPATRADVTRYAHEMTCEDGLTVFWATHLVDEVSDGDRLIVLHNGSIVADGDAGEIAAGRPVGEAFSALTGAGP